MSNDNDGVFDADRAPQPPTNMDDDAAREWLARWDAFAIAALTGLCVSPVMDLKVSAAAARIANNMMRIQPGDTE